MRYVAVWLMAGMLLVLCPVGFAQEPDLTNETDEEPIVQDFDRTFGEEITVTGTLIPRPTLESLSPVTVMDVTEELTYSGLTRVEDLMISLPQVFAAQSSRFANGADGTATISLRYLGPNRTLVLINGRRSASGNLFGGDLNVVPPSLVKRVDVLTGGASTVYGTDAVAGVVNFVLDTDFTGVRGNIQYSFFQHDNRNELAREINEAAGYEVPTGSVADGEAIGGHLAVGGRFADGKGHGVAYVEYRNIEEVNLGQRDYSNCAINRGAEGPYCGGSATSGQGTFYAFNAAGGFQGAYTLHTAEEGGDGHSLRPWRGEMYNYNPFNPYQRPDEKWNAGGFGHYTFDEYLEPYIEAMFMYDVTDAIIAPSGNWSHNRLNCDNPMLSDQQRFLLCESAGYGPTDYATVYMLRRNVEGGARTNYLDHSNLRIVAGVRGDLGDNWGYDFYGLHAQNKKTDIYEKDLHVERMANALDIVVDPDTGEWVCRSEDPGCVPWNIFQEGGVTEEALDYMYADLIALTDSRTQVVNLTFSGDLEGYGIRLPSANEGLGVAVGAEYRSEELHIQPDENYQQGVGGGQGGGYPPVDGHYDVSEFFIEAAVPLIQDAGGFEDLSMELGYRYSDFSTSGGYNTYKALLNWAITDSWRIRGGYNRAVRAANVYELFEPQQLGLGLNQDICANDPATGEPLATLEECMRTGVTEEQYGNILPHPSEQYNTLSGGNPFLVPETADTWTAGVVWTPQRIPGLSLTVDYFNIDISDTILTLPAGDIMVTCANTGDPDLCRLINRDEQGSLWLTEDSYVETSRQNIGRLKSEGVDLHFNDLIGLGGAGFLSLDLIGTYLMTSSIDNRLTSYDCVGYFGYQCGQPNPHWQHRLRATWETAFNTFFSLGWRIVGSSEIDDASPDPDLGDPGQMELWRINDADKIDTFQFLDFSVSYDLKQKYRFTVGVNNILDTEPPFFWGSGNGTWDPLGRYFFANFQFSL